MLPMETPGSADGGANVGEPGFSSPELGSEAARNSGESRGAGGDGNDGNDSSLSCALCGQHIPDEDKITTGTGYTHYHKPCWNTKRAFERLFKTADERKKLSDFADSDPERMKEMLAGHVVQHRRTKGIITCGLSRNGGGNEHVPKSNMLNIQGLSLVP